MNKEENIDYINSIHDSYIKELQKQDEYIKKLEQENQKYKEVIDKAIYHLDFFISDTNLSKYDTLKILMHAKKILKRVDKEVE